MNFKSRIKSILFWSIISAAFIGPGTVTTAALAGASYGSALLWTLLFATLSTIVLQESAARITLASGMSFGEIIASKFKGKQGNLFGWFVVIAILSGGAAYQAGNLLGAVSGLSLQFDIDSKILVVVIAIAASALLFTGKPKTIANVLGVLVAIMGILFVFTAFTVEISLEQIISSSFIPTIPDGSDLLVIGLIGTTIVPYNLFLASSLSGNQSKNEMRVGITGAVVLGGLISMAILLTGMLVEGEFSFESLARALTEKAGPWAGVLLGFGLFAAGFTSSITAPYASALTAQSVLGVGKSDWGSASTKFRLVWGLTILAGVIIGVSGFRPVPVIIMAQAMNGILLPFMVILIYSIINDPLIIPIEDRNGKLANLILLVICGITAFLGLNNVVHAILKTF